MRHQDCWKFDSHALLWTTIALAWILLALPGCTWFRHQRHARGPLPPPAFDSAPTLNDIVAAINRNSQHVQQLQTNGASIRVDGVPASLQADLAVEKPRRFRLTAKLTGFTGREIDLGSNDDIFWLWIRRNPQPAVLYARHDQFAHSAARRIIAVDPTWFIDALGIGEVDPSGNHQGPFPAGEDRVEIRTVVPQPDGPWTRVLIVNDKYAWVLEQHLYDAAGRLAASVFADDFGYSPEHDATLPHKLRLQIGPGQPSQIGLDLDVSSYTINQVFGNAQQLWSMPHIEGTPQIDITSPQFNPQMLAPAPQIVPPSLQWNRRIAAPAAPVPYR